MRIPAELTVVFVAGLFGLIPLIVQIATTRAQRKDRVTRINTLRAELEFLVQLNALQEKVGATDETAKSQTNRVISDSLGKLLDQYNKLSHIPSAAAAGGEQSSPRQLSFFRRAFLLYEPQTNSGWVLHTLFYVFAFYVVSLSLIAILFFDLVNILEAGLFVIPLGVALLILQRFARRNADRKSQRHSLRGTWSLTR